MVLVGVARRPLAGQGPSNAVTPHSHVLVLPEKDPLRPLMVLCIRALRGLFLGWSLDQPHHNPSKPSPRGAS
jgi:hypothetical protein